MYQVLEKAGVRAVIDPFGAQLISLQDREGIEYIWQRDERYWKSCAPVLFPVVGRPRGGMIRVGELRYPMPQHGFASRSAFALGEADAGSAAFLLESSQESLLQYPYRFRLWVRFILLEDGLTVRYRVENADERTMVFGIGGHPGINCPLVRGERFEDYELRFEFPETVLSPTVSEGGEILYSRTQNVLHGEKTLRLDYGLFETDAVILEGLRSREVALVGAKSGRGIRFSFPDYQTIAFWTPAGKHAPFLCFEPWFGMGARDDEPSDELAGKHGMVRLQPAGQWSADYSIRFLR